jgi:RAD51-like protein 2
MAITIDAAENVLSSVKRHSNSVHISGSTPRQQTRPPTQAASFLMNAQQAVSTTYSPMDNLLCGGVRRGQVLEISGPPGSPKEALLLKVVSAFVELGEEVVFLGKVCSYIQIDCLTSVKRHRIWCRQPPSTRL